MAGVVLAAGTSSRLGRNKLFIEIEGESLVRRAVRHAAAGGLDPVLVVVGHEARRVEAELAGLPCRPVANAEFASGQASSVRAGIAAVPPEAAAAVVVLADMPRVTAERIAELVERYREGRAPAVALERPGGAGTDGAGGSPPWVLAVVSDYGGVVAPPILYDRRVFPELLALSGPGCAKKVLARHREETVALERPAEELVDVDDEDDLLELQRALESQRLSGQRHRPPHPSPLPPAGGEGAGGRELGPGGGALSLGERDGVRG